MNSSDLPRRGGESRGRTKSSAVKFPHQRLILFLYLIIIVAISLYLIIFIWVPTDFSKKTEKIEPADPSIVAKANTTDPALTPDRVVKELSISENTTSTVTTNNTFVILKDGTKQLLTRDQTVTNKVNITGFIPNTLLSKNPEVRLISISALFGLLGGSVSGINSLLNRRIWDSGRHVNIRRLLYNYYSRPWLAMAVGIITYVILRAGLLNVGTASNITIINEFGVAGITALVGLMTDEIILKLRDIFRTLFGITSLEKQKEIQLSVQKNSITIGEQIEISAILTDIRPNENKELIANFFIQDTRKIELVPDNKKEEKFTEGGVATVVVKGVSEGKTKITAILFGDSDLFDTQEIEVIGSNTSIESSSSNSISIPSNSSNPVEPVD